MHATADSAWPVFVRCQKSRCLPRPRDPLRVESVVTGETRQYLENGMERMLRSRQETTEMKERSGIVLYMDKTLASNRKRYLQLVRAVLKRDLVTLIDVNEVRERWKNQEKTHNG